MAKDLFYSLDLNLLRTFLVLSQELNMRKASQRLFVSQPAISQALQKLRNHFGDELFVKVPKGLTATPFAEQLATSITPLLDGLASELNKSDLFDPKEINYSIKIAVSPIVLTCLSGSLFHRIKEQAPNCTLELIGWNHATMEDIQRDQVLIGVGYEQDAMLNIYEQKVAVLTGKIIVRKDHPIKTNPVSPQDMVGYEIASIITPGWNDNFSVAAEIMKRAGFEAKIGFRSEFALAAVNVAQHTDMYIPHSNLFPIEQFPALKMLDVNVDDSYMDTPLFCYYHSKYRRNPLVTWIAEQIAAVLNEQTSR
jgi:DNA-binding transcriptional LysR family regulator